MFDTISEFLIPKPALCGHPTSIGIDQYRMLGHPVLLEDPKYPRNVALWNLVLVVDRGADVRGLEPPVTKLAQVFRSLELEAEYMTNAKYRPALYSVLQQLVHDLNTMREARIAVPHSSVILDIRLAPVLSAHPPEVNLWDVPVPALDFAHVPLTGWDLTLTRLVPLINGTRSVYQLAHIADVDPALVRVAIQHLVHVGAVYLVDVFQLTNMYVPTAKLRRLANDVDAQEACVQYILRPNHLSPPPSSALTHVLLTPTRVLTLYASLKPGVTVAEFMANSAFPTNVADIRRFVVFGVTKGWIRRVHRYPI
ncbi:nitrogen permease regulator 2, partial [Catenaria anguillulae PL171]